jgi:hypothetical protein
VDEDRVCLTGEGCGGKEEEEDIEQDDVGEALVHNGDLWDKYKGREAGLSDGEKNERILPDVDIFSAERFFKKVNLF